MSGTAVDLVLVEEFLNTLDQRTFSRHGSNHVTLDELTSVEAWAAWLEAHGLPVSGQPPRRGDLDAARSLRAALRAAITGGDDGAAARALAEFPLQLTPDSTGGLRLSAVSGVDGIDRLVETVATSLATGRWSRLRLCAAPDCRWAFYDTSRSGAGRWCSMEVCGNRHKTRAYRQRRAD